MNKRAFSVLYMFVITLFFTSLVTAVRVANDERIQTNQKVELQKVILNVLSVPVAADASNEDLVDLFEKRVKTKMVDGRTVYMVYDPSGKTPVRYAVEVGGAGFWGPISAMVATDGAVEKIVDIVFFRHQETPGLGARITEQWFEDQFANLSLTPDPNTKTFFSMTPPAPNKKPRELDAITGATQTSRAVESFLNKELEVVRKIQMSNEEK